MNSHVVSCCSKFDIIELFINGTDTPKAYEQVGITCKLSKDILLVLRLKVWGRHHIWRWTNDWALYDGGINLCYHGGHVCEVGEVACRGGADGATAPDIHPGGIQGASFRKKT